MATKTVIEESDNIKASQLKELFRQIDEKIITGEMLQTFLENPDVKILLTRFLQQGNTVKDMRDTLRFCARNDVGTYYQQTAALEMLKGTKITYKGHNSDGTYDQNEIDWVRRCGGQEAADKVLAYEKELLAL